MPKHGLPVIAGAAVALILFVFLAVRSYDGNVSALLHMDVNFAERMHAPSGIVLYEDGGYDGMAYYQVARDIPLLLSGGTSTFDSPYRFQRITLPLLVYAITLGNETAFPFAFLLINIAAAITSLILVLLLTRSVNIHAVTIVFNPAILVGILFSLTEPVSIAFILFFFWLWKRRGRLDAWPIAALTLSLFARETTIFIIALLLLWFLWRRERRNAALMLIPISLLFLWQYFLLLRFGSVGFQANTNIVDPPFLGIVTVIRWAFEHEGIAQMYRLSSIALLVFFLPLCVVFGKEWMRRTRSIDRSTFLLSGLVITMLSMDAHMWGVITSIGRVVAPIYPVYALYAAEHDSRFLRLLSMSLIAISIIAAVGIALQTHPFRIS